MVLCEFEARVEVEVGVEVDVEGGFGGGWFCVGLWRGEGR